MEKNEWTLHTQNFGKINEANITVSPFMMFVGHNNSGKSYIMELLWGLLVKARSYSSKINLQLFEDFKEEILLELKSKDEIEKEISEEFQEQLIKEWNRILATEKGDLVKEIFQYDVNIDSLSISRASYLPIKVIFSREHSFFTESEKEINILRYKLLIDKEVYSSLGIVGMDSQGMLIDQVIQDLFSLQLRYDYYQSSFRGHLNDSDKHPIYFPASRTGFIQTYKAIVGNLLEVKEGQFIYEDESRPSRAIEGTTLTWPTSDYLLKLLKLTSNKDKEREFKEELAFLEQHLLKGAIRKTEASQFEFVTRSNEVLPLHVTSSLVSELAPLYLFLTSANQSKLWLIEEIESHLHPSMQMQISRLLMRLTHKDLRIWITTHSDSVIQMVNNMMVLSQKENRQELLNKLNWTEQDLPYELADVRLYQFLASDEGTVIDEVMLGEGGFEVTTFNDALDALIQDTVIVQMGGE